MSTSETTLRQLFERRRDGDVSPVVGICVGDVLVPDLVSDPAINEILDRSFINNYGSPEYNDEIIIWTEDYVYSLSEYDGLLYFSRAPRSPGVRV